MVVEDHQIRESEATRVVEITISGRSYDSIFEERQVGGGKAFPVTLVTGDSSYQMASDFTWNQAVQLMKAHIGNLVNNSWDMLGWTEFLSQTTVTGTAVVRSIERGSLSERLIELLAVDDLGIKSVRPGSPVITTDPLYSAFVVHNGTDRSNTVVFSYNTGEVSNAEYLWTTRGSKNVAYVVSKWIETVVEPYFFGDPKHGEYNTRRVMMVDASDLDNSYSTAPTGTAYTNTLLAMQERGKMAILAQKPITLTNAEIAPNAPTYKFRTDYNVGDIVRVKGDYNESAKMRVSEYVESEDETGMRGYPTLTLV
jgi:hypothetical protein